MILIFGGTTEGRKAAAICDIAAKPFFYSTKADYQQIEAVHAISIHGAMDKVALLDFCRNNGIGLIIDAAHPFAEVLHRTIAGVSEELSIPVVRYERNYPERLENIVWMENYEEAIDYLEKQQCTRLLALTGVNSIAKLKPYWKNHHCIFRILNRPESIAIVEKEHFPLENIIYYQPEEADWRMFENIKPDWILTKESGDSGGFGEKVKAAEHLNIPLLVIKRPQLPKSFITVSGENGLRKAIEQNFPSFFPLKTGYTTGSYATAATKAALIALLTREVQHTSSIFLPSGELITLPIHSTSFDDCAAICSALKEAGDDPDITNRSEIVARVQFNSNHSEIRFLKGAGVGVVTLPGLGIAVGEPAINATPRKMIEREISSVLQNYSGDEVFNQGVDVTISVPEGEVLAKKTFNPKLGIIGGISIIGTSGIVYPFSSEAFVESIKREMQVAKALGCKRLVLNSGSKSEKEVKQIYPDLIPQAFIHFGNFIGESIRIANELGFDELTLGVMIGKAVKLAEGHLDTHSKKVEMNRDFLVKIAEESACSPESIESIRTLTLARQLWDIIVEKKFYDCLLQHCYSICKPLFPQGKLEILLIGECGEIIKSV